MPDIVVMFFLLGLVAGAVKSDLEVPKATYDTLSLLLMLTIGLKGGMALYGNIHWGLVPELLGVALLSPLSDPGAVPIYNPPPWFGGVSIAAVVVGHLVAIWVAHAAAYDLFPARLQAIRSQYPFIAVMVFYTMTSLLIVSRPYAAPPFV